MIDTKDILWIVIAVSVATLTAFFAWVLYQVGHLLKQSNQIVEDIRHKLASITEMVSTIGDKINRSTSTISAVATGVERILAHIKTKRRNRRNADEA